MATAQESGLRENCTSRLSERAEAGRKLHLPRLYSDETGVMPVERRERVIAIESGQLLSGDRPREEPDERWKTAVFVRWHEPEAAAHRG